MERMKKILTSPISKKKSVAVTSPRYFGVPLEELRRREETAIPQLVQKICIFIQTHGLNHEGVFRINGNARVVERIKAAFDRAGDADLTDAGDIAAVASVLKLFLRELPGAVVPEHMTKVFVSTQEEHCKDAGECARRLKTLVQRLPTANQDLLKYLCRFLVTVTTHEATNKMSPMALGIVFGPNIFSYNRCSAGIDGLRMQGTTNQITLQFITKYDQIFHEEGEISPYSANFSQSKVKRSDSNVSEDTTSGLNDVTNDVTSGGSDDTARTGSSVMHTPRGISDDEFIMDSDRSEAGSSVVTSPRTAHASHEVVDKAITSAISKHIFGDNSPTSFSSDEASDANAPVPAPRRKRREKPESDSDVTREETDGSRQLTVKQRILRLQQQEEDVSSTDSHNETQLRKKQRPKSQAFQMFEEKGILIGMASDAKQRSPTGDDEEKMDYDVTNENAESRPTPKPRRRPQGVHGDEELMESVLGDKHGAGDSDDSGFETVQRGSTLSMFKKAPGPKNRRMPSRGRLRHHKNNQSDPTLNHSTEYEPELLIESMQNKGKSQGDLLEDVNHNDTRKQPDSPPPAPGPGAPQHRFLELHPRRGDGGSAGEGGSSPDEQRSPAPHRKPFVPPLDLSILHEHGDGNEPISVKHGGSVSMEKSQPISSQPSTMLSPRTSSLNKKVTMGHTDCNVPPSPPAEQSLQFNKSMRLEDDHAAQVKTLTKKIQSCKRKIKLFEESFETEYGYRPSQSDKASRPEIKKCMQELARARKDLRKVKSEAVTKENDASPLETSTFLVTANPSFLDTTGFVSLPRNNGDGAPLPEETLHLLLARLNEKRRDAGRPQDLALMSREQVPDEKLDLQKALKQYEGLHGRPTSKQEKELMKPLYDRYRTVKRIISKPTSPRDKLNLESVPEEHTIEFMSPSPGSKSSKNDATYDQDGGLSPDADDLLISRDVTFLRDTTMTSQMNSNTGNQSPESLSPPHKESSLHELSVPELLTEQSRTRTEKKKLRRVLREFEDDFLARTGRKVTKEDRSPRETEYHEYKQVKARLKLLEALLSKHHDPLNEF